MNDHQAYLLLDFSCFIWYTNFYMSNFWWIIITRGIIIINVPQSIIDGEEQAILSWRKLCVWILLFYFYVCLNFLPFQINDNKYSRELKFSTWKVFPFSFFYESEWEQSNYHLFRSYSYIKQHIKIFELD